MDERPKCDWYVPKDGHVCYHDAHFKWGNRFICASHAAGWLRQGKHMERLPGVTNNPYPGNEFLWGLTKEPQT